MTLSEKQRLFTRHVGDLIRQAFAMGYEAVLAEAERPAATAEFYARQGKGIKNSLHTKRLAVDLLLFKDGIYLTRSSDYMPLGEWWEGQHDLARWGGRFGDGNHFSFTHGGVR